MMALRALLAEAARRLEARKEADAWSRRHVERLLATRFDKQRAFILDPARRKAALCTRRAGKTEADSAYLLVGALGGPQRICVFMARTRLRAKELTWKAVLDLIALLGLVEGKDYTANLSTLTISFSNGSEVRWRGADNIADLRRKRGDKLWLVIIDEAQDIEAPILRELVDDVMGPALEDMEPHGGGVLCLTGTPGHVCAGYWYGVTCETAPAEHQVAGWSVHRWSVLENPFMAHMKQRLPELMVERGWTDESPTYVREWLGRWVNDTGALFYKFDPGRNLYDTGKVKPYGDGWCHIRGWDLGHTDAMALVYWGFHRNDSNLYEAYSWKASGVTSDAVQKHAQEIEAKLGLNVVGSVADTGGLGKVVVEEVSKRSGEFYEAARKTDKAGHVRLMNDDFLSGRIRLRSGSPYACEVAVLPKVADWDEAKTGKAAPEDPRFPNHCCDSGLYAWRWAWNYLGRAVEPEPKPGTKEYAQKQEAELMAAMERAAEEASTKEWWEQ